jgi:PTH1 family peptidyl-tRNA hydrolase
MRLVAGLGNPGREYEATRHNAGFWWVDRLTSALGVTLEAQSRFHGKVGRLRGEDDCWFVEPQTYMNRSGQAVGALCTFYKIAPADVLVVHDELDLPVGAVRLKKGGGVAGHNGLKDIAARIGLDFWRLRIGIGHPGSKEAVTGHVLGKPVPAERELMLSAIEAALDVWPELAAGNYAAAQLKLHTAAK